MGSGDTRQQVHAVSQQCSDYVLVANKLFNNDNHSLVDLLKLLQSIGYGEEPPAHPRHGELTDEDKVKMTAQEILERNDYVVEARERVKRMGKKDLLFLKELDADENLILEKDEMMQVIDQQIADHLADQLSVDHDGDGSLTIKEYCLMVPTRGEVDENGADWHQRGHFKHEDSNSDGLISQEEMVNHYAEDVLYRASKIPLAVKLLQLDLNHDGEVSLEELYKLTPDNQLCQHLLNGKKAFVVKELWQNIYWSRETDIAAFLNL